MFLLNILTEKLTPSTEQHEEAKGMNTSTFNIEYANTSSKMGTTFLGTNLKDSVIDTNGATKIVFQIVAQVIQELELNANSREMSEEPSTSCAKPLTEEVSNKYSKYKDALI